MSRYSNSGGSTGSNSGDYDDTTLKLQKYAAISVTGNRVNAYNSEYGDKFIVGFEDVDVLDGVVFQREDKPGTWKVFSAGKWFNLNPDDGLVYESYDPEADEYEGQMSAQDVLDHPRVLGFSETFGGDDYFYKPIGVIIEEGGDVALNDEVVGTEDGLSEEQAERARSETVIPVGEVSMLLSNKAWTRTLAKKITQSGEAAVADGDDAYEDFGWLTTDEPELRPELDGREMELWLTEEPIPGEDSDGTYTTPNLKDVKTDNFITIENGIQSDGDSGSSSSDGATSDESTGNFGNSSGSVSNSDSSSESAQAATDGGQPEDDADDGDDGDGLPGDVPDVLDDLLDYFARTQGEASAEELREFAADEVDDPDAVDWEAAADEVASRA